MVNLLFIIGGKMEELYWKDDFNAKCPHCGYDNEMVMYLNTDEVCCQGCDNDFYVQLMGSHTLKTSK